MLSPDVRGRGAHCGWEEAWQHLHQTLLHLDRGHQNSFDGSSILLPFEQRLADGAPDNIPSFCPVLLASLLFAFPPSSPTSDGAALGRSGNDQAMVGALSPSKSTNKRPAVPNPAGGSCGNAVVNTLGRCFLPTPRLRMQRGVLLP